MKYLLFVLLMAPAFASEKQLINMDQIRGRIVNSYSAFNTTVILGFKYVRGTGPKSYVFLYNYSTKEVWEIEDRRIFFGPIVGVTTFKNQFVILDPISKRLFHITPTGDFHDMTALNTFDGFQEGQLLSFIIPLGEGLFAATISDAARENHSLVTIDLENRAIDTLFTKASDDSIYWIPCQKFFYQVKNFAGHISLLDGSTFKHVRTIYQQDKPAKALSGKAMPHMFNPLIVGDTLSFTRNIREKNEILKKGLQIHTKTQKWKDHEDYILVGMGKEGELIYKYEQQEVFFQPHSEQKQ